METEIAPIKDKKQEYLDLNKANEGKIHISFSEFSKYLECPHRHLIDKYLKLTPDETSIHLIFGNSIHLAIELGVKEKLSLVDRIARFKEDFIKNMRENLINHESYKEVDNYVKQGEHILKSLNIEKIGEKYDIIGVEIILYENLYKNFYFKGFIDLVLKSKTENKYLIIDWKTSTASWDVSKKKKDKIFIAQMRFYKYFYARKFNVPIDNIDCKYIVLNRLKSKQLPDLGFGEIQPVEIFSTIEDIEKSLVMLAESMEGIHIKKEFLKAKLNNRKQSCFFCPLKNNEKLCNSDPDQYKKLLAEYKK